MIRKKENTGQIMEMAETHEETSKRTKSKFFKCGLVVVAVGILSVAAWFIYQNTREYRYTEYDTSVTITRYQGHDEEVEIPAEIHGKPVNIIGESAFADCKEIRSVNIPDGVWTISDSAFARCENLTTVILPDSVSTLGAYAFKGCSSLSFIALPSLYTTFGEGLFEQCENLTSIGIEDIFYDPVRYAQKENQKSTEEVVQEEFDEETKALLEASDALLEKYELDMDEDMDRASFSSVDDMLDTYPNITEVFYYNSRSMVGDGVGIEGYEGSETSVVIPSEINGKPVTEICTRAFWSRQDVTDVVIPDQVRSIGHHAFELCIHLNHITIPDSVTEIGVDAFSLSALEEVVIPVNVTEIATNTFSYCIGLKSVTIPDGVTGIGLGAFSYCLSLEEITIPDSVTSIDVAAFKHCENLKNIAIPESVAYIGEGAFEDCRSLTNVKIPDSIAQIENFTFAYCTSLEEVIIPEGVTEIGTMAFTGCISLANLKLPDSVATISMRAFAYCSSLSELFIPESVNTIGTEAFGACEGLRNITVFEKTTINPSAFTGCTNLTIHKTGAVVVPTLDDAESVSGVESGFKYFQ